MSIERVAGTHRDRVLVIEDDPEIGPMTVELLSDDYDVELRDDGPSGLRTALQEHFSVIVLDRRMPGMSGVEVAEALRRAGGNTPIIMLTALGDVDDIVDGLDAGANDYMVKPYRIEELKARIRALRRSFTSALRRREIGDWTHLPDQRAVLNPGEERILLTEAENRLLGVLSSAPDRSFSREQLRDAAFTPDDSLNLIDTYVHYLRRKTTPGLVQTVRGVGYRIGTPHD
ncbi:response regulator transcription factor [Pseudoclavibacter soli]|uniref:response regulator transcription factor n=1 Tax=Pseudoclavibacter soli TaxID=452623 RepID=UPI000428FAF5|nr:response regulator transcription factor [Pseudoclavibacter soli]